MSQHQRSVVVDLVRFLIVAILAFVQSTSAQHMFTIRLNADLTTPSASTDRFLPSYDTWRTTSSVGADLTVALAGPAFWVLSFEYTAREFARFRHPFNEVSFRTYGGSGRIIRGGMSAGVRVQAWSRVVVSARFGFELFDSQYDPVYYDNGIWWEVTPGPTVDRALDASARYVAPVGAVGFSYSLLGPADLVLDLTAHRDGSGEYYYGSSIGLGITF